MTGRDTELIRKGCALLKNDPGIAEGFRENFSILKLVLEFLQKWKGMAKLCPCIEGYWRNLVGGCVCVSICVCAQGLFQLLTLISGSTIFTLILSLF